MSEIEGVQKRMQDVSPVDVEDRTSECGSDVWCWDWS